MIGTKFLERKRILKKSYENGLVEVKYKRGKRVGGTTVSFG